MAQSHHGIDPRRAPGRDVTGQRGYREQDRCCYRDCERIGAGDTEKLTGHYTAGCQGKGQADCYADRDQCDSLPQHHCGHIASLGSQRHTYANLACSPGDSARAVAGRALQFRTSDSRLRMPLGQSALGGLSARRGPTRFPR